MLPIAFNFSTWNFRFRLIFIARLIANIYLPPIKTSEARLNFVFRAYAPIKKKTLNGAIWTVFLLELKHFSLYRHTKTSFCGKKGKTHFSRHKHTHVVYTYLILLHSRGVEVVHMQFVSQFWVDSTHFRITFVFELIEFPPHVGVSTGGRIIKTCSSQTSWLKPFWFGVFSHFHVHYSLKS